MYKSLKERLKNVKSQESRARRERKRILPVIENPDDRDVENFSDQSSGWEFNHIFFQRKTNICFFSIHFFIILMDFFILFIVKFLTFANQPVLVF